MPARGGIVWYCSHFACVRREDSSVISFVVARLRWAGIGECRQLLAASRDHLESLFSDHRINDYSARAVQLVVAAWQSAPHALANGGIQVGYLTFNQRGLWVSEALALANALDNSPLTLHHFAFFIWQVFQEDFAVPQHRRFGCILER